MGQEKRARAAGQAGLKAFQIMIWEQPNAMSSVPIEFDHLWRNQETPRPSPSQEHERRQELLTPKVMFERSRFADHWLERSIYQYQSEAKDLHQMEIEYGARLREKKEKVRRLQEQIQQAEGWRLSLDRSAPYLIENKQVIVMADPSAETADPWDTPRRLSHHGDPVAESSREEVEVVNLEEENHRTRPKEAKSFQLLVSCALATGICIASLIMALGTIAGANQLAPVHFWLPIAVGTFGVAGSNYIYLRRLWR